MRIPAKHIKRYLFFYASLFGLSFIFVDSLTAQELQFSSEFMLKATANSRLKANATIKGTGPKKGWDILSGVKNSDIDSVTSVFASDSVTWYFFFRTGTSLGVSFPNDVTLICGKDRGELQAMLLDNLKKGSHKREKSAAYSPCYRDDSLLHKTEELLTAEKITSISFLADSTAICDVARPYESLLSSLNDSNTCKGLFPVVLHVSGYGQKKDTLMISLCNFISALGNTNWDIEYARDKNGLLILFQHPFMGFYHMVSFTLKDTSTSKYWQAQLHSYIPSYNLTNLYGTHRTKGRAEKFVIK